MSNNSLVSLFSGFGGLDYGLYKAGFYPLAFSENDPYALETLKKMASSEGIDADFYEDINDVNVIGLLNQLRLKPGELDLLAGGPPCQTFSYIGKRNSLQDPRGLLLYKIIDFAEVFRPKVILLEQVKGLISAKGQDKKRGSVLKCLVSQLQSLGYFVTYKILCAADYGVPQLRYRMFLVASKNWEFLFPMPTHIDPKVIGKRSSSIIDCKLASYVTLKEAIGDLPSPVKKGEKEEILNHVDVTPCRDRERINGVPEGECLAKQLHLPEEQRKKLNPSKDTTKFRRLSWQLPSLTIRGGEVFYHPTEDRYLTPREYMRIQGFPDHVRLYGPIRGRTGTVKNLDQHRLVANAVPFNLAYLMGQEIITQLLK